MAAPELPVRLTVFGPPGVAFTVSVSPAPRVRTDFGLNVTSMLQLAPPARPLSRAVAQPFTAESATENSAVFDTTKDSGPLVWLVPLPLVITRATVWLSPTKLLAPKARVVPTDSTESTTPVASTTATVSGPLSTLVPSMVTVAWGRAPVMVGLNLTLTLQLAPTPRVAVQSLSAVEKSFVPPPTVLVRASPAAACSPVLVMTQTLLVLVVFTM